MIRPAAALLALGACSSSASPPGRPPPATADDAAITTGDDAMIDQLQQLVRFLSQDPLSVADVVARIGPVVSDPGIPQQAELKASLPGVRAVRLGRYPDTGLPYLLVLDLAEGARPTAATLRATFGDYKRGRSDRGQPAQLLFYPPAEGKSWHVVLLAELGPITGSLEDAQVTRLSLRRDPASTTP